MQQTAVLKLGNYSATVTVVLLYSIGLHCVFCTASISGGTLFYADNSQFSCINRLKNLYFHANAYCYEWY